MSSESFMMGEFEATFPDDRLYAQNHMWAQPKEDGESFRFGLGSYAVRLLQDVYFLDWEIDAPAEIKQKQELGSIESKKAESSIYSPATGTMTELNTELLSDPSGINVDKYGDGWMFDMKIRDPDFLTASQYIEYLDTVWQDAQRTIKGQMNQ